MRIRLNGHIFSSLTEVRDSIGGEVAGFLEEWLDEKAYVTGHTSGSTGKPKEIRLNKEDMRASARITNEFLGIDSNSVLFLCLSVSYIAGKMMVVRALEAGAELLLGEITSRPLRERSRMKIDLAAMVPMQVEESLKHPEEKQVLAEIRQLLVGGAPVSLELEEELKDIPTVCYATYGMTETVSHVALRRLNEGENYCALGKITFSIDKRGCLIVHAPHLLAGEFITNDLAELVDERHFKWLGRYDNVINSGGVKFFPELIEAKMAGCVSRRYFITARPDKRLGQRIVLVLEGKPQGKVEKMQLLRALRLRLTPYEMPREILYLPYFFETASGKIIRRV